MSCYGLTVRGEDVNLMDLDVKEVQGLDPIDHAWESFCWRDSGYHLVAVEGKRNAEPP